MGWLIEIFNAILGRSEGKWGELVEKYDKRLADVEKRSEICEERHRQRDLADADRTREIAELKMTIENCEEDRGELRETIATQNKHIEAQNIQIAAQNKKLVALAKQIRTLQKKR